MGRPLPQCFWGIAGLLVGVVIALQLTFPNLLYFPEWGFTNFGRLRPLHTSAVIFAFGGNVLLATSFLCRSENLPYAAGWRHVALVCLLGLSDVHRHGRNRLFDRCDTIEGICRA